MSNELVSSVAIDDIRYDSYLLTDESKDTLGNVRKMMDIWVLERTVDTRYLFNKCPTTLTEYDRVMIHFYFDLKTGIVHEPDADNPHTEYGEVSEYVFDLDHVEDKDLVKSLIVVGPNQEDLLQVRIHLNPWIDPTVSTTVNTQASFDEITWIRFENCKFTTGLELRDRSHLLIELVNCEIFKSLQIYESRDPNILSDMNVVIENSVLNQIDTVLLSRLSILSFRSNVMHNLKKTKSYFEAKQSAGEEITASDYISPTFKVSLCKKAIVEGFKINNILNGIEFNAIDDLTINGFYVNHVDAGKTLRSTLYVNDGKIFKGSNLYTNGVIVDKLEKVQIAGLVIQNSFCKNAEFGVQVNRITGSIALSGLRISEDTVKSGVVISSCEATVSICDCYFDKIQTGIYVTGCTSDLVVTDCIFSENTVTACKLHLCQSRAIVMDSTFTRNKVSIVGQLSKKIDIINVDVQGSIAEGRPNFDTLDIATSNVDEFRIIGSRMKIVTIHSDVASMLSISESSIMDSYLSFNNIGESRFLKSVFKLDGVKKIEGQAWFELTTGKKTEFDVCEFSDTTPQLTYIDTVKINDNTFIEGLRLVGCGDSSSQIRENVFGDIDKAKAHTVGLTLNNCKGFDIDANIFAYGTGVTGISLEESMYNIITETNQFKSPGIIIDASITGPINGNHIISDNTIETDLRPKIRSNSVFRYALYVLNRKKYLEQYPQAPDINTLTELLSLCTNIVSFVDPKEDWVKTYKALLNAEIKTLCNTL